MRTAIKLFISIAIAGFFFWLAFRDFTSKDFDDLIAVIASAHYGLLISAFFVLVISHILRAWRWGILLSSVKSNMSLINLFNSTMIGYAVNQALPRVGELTKSFNLSKLEAIDPKKVLASVVVERILDSLFYALILAGSVFLFRKPINAAFEAVSFFGFQVSVEILAYLMLLSAVVIWIIASAISLFPEEISGHVLRFFKRVNVSDTWSERIARWTASFIEGSGALKNRTKFSEIYVSSFVIWGLYWVAAILPMYAIDLPKFGIGIWETLVVMCISALGQLVTPAGAGTYQYACTLALESLFKVGKSDAAAYALITFFIQLLSSAAVGLISFLWQQARLSAHPLTAVKSSE